jgi:hypothetical protein
MLQFLSHYLSISYLQRGKFFPQLTNLVRINTPKAVQTESRKAFRKLPNLESAMASLTNLKGVGTTLASGWSCYLKCAFLSCSTPDSAIWTFLTIQMFCTTSRNVIVSTKIALQFVYEVCYYQCKVKHRRRKLYMVLPNNQWSVSCTKLFKTSIMNVLLLP